MHNRIRSRTLVVGALVLTSAWSQSLAAHAASNDARRGAEGKVAPSGSAAAAVATSRRHLRLPVPGSDGNQPLELASKLRSPTLAKPAPPPAHEPFEPGRVSFSLKFHGLESPFSTISAFVLPGASLEIEADGVTGSLGATSDGGVLVSTGATSWTWTAPSAHGRHEILFRQRGASGVEEARLNVFVLHPYDGGDRVGAYRLGRYQSKTKDGTSARPPGFVEVGPDDLDVMVSPHFRLGQFLCKGAADWPKYVALRTPLLLKLEKLMAALDERGLPAKTLHVMSGFRTPAYNAGIGNRTSYSRHLYGDAADVFLDRDGDGKQDDLDGDGKSTREDARILYELVEGTLDDAVPGQMAGGLSAYGPNHAHGPFLHIDARGHRARW